MYAFLASLPVWLYVILGIIAGWLYYKWWKHKKATAYDPHMVWLPSLDFTTLRDNPKASK